MSVDIRAATAADLPAILALEHASETAPHWPLQSYGEILQPSRPSPSMRRRLAVATIGGAVVGFAVTQIPSAGLAGDEDSIAELESVVVAAHLRRTGIGRALCMSVLVGCRALEASAIILEVRSQSSGAIALYRSLGFARTGTRAHYYREPDDDAWIMRLDLR
jgi:ribosomal-protein-alanine N-acetyltransferase